MASKAEGGEGPSIPWRLILWAIPVGLLMIAWLAHFPWTSADFIVAAAIFAIFGGTFELAVRASGNSAYRAGAAAALVTAFLLTWVNLAVGIIGNEDNPLNLMFYGVIAAALAGSIAARFRPDGMSRAMIVSAVIQALIGIGVLLTGAAATEPPGRIGLLILIESFAALWLLSAWFFRKAAAAPSNML
ncbi:MAG TPA: hypothetical protein VE820_13695 [Sphingomicrobium sp.]|jgi:hypothetical protein|nr:hypothetical protein [Sphingomicrobium sp.]